MKIELLATSTVGLETVVSRELEALGYRNHIVETGRVLFQGDRFSICRTNIWLRTAGRVLLKIGAFPVMDFGSLFDRTFELPWDQWIPADAAFPVKGRSQ